MEKEQTHSNPEAGHALQLEKTVPVIGLTMHLGRDVHQQMSQRARIKSPLEEPLSWC